jgi:hypothetical protein
VNIEQIKSMKHLDMKVKKAEEELKRVRKERKKEAKKEGQAGLHQGT